VGSGLVQRSTGRPLKPFAAHCRNTKDDFPKFAPQSHNLP